MHLKRLQLLFHLQKTVNSNWPNLTVTVYFPKPHKPLDWDGIITDFAIYSLVLSTSQAESKKSSKLERTEN